MRKTSFSFKLCALLCLVPLAQSCSNLVDVTTNPQELTNALFVDNFGAVGDGITYDDAAFQTAAAQVVGCGKLVLGKGKRYHLAGAWQLPDCVWISGTLPQPALPDGQTVTSTFATDDAILLDPTTKGIIRGPASGIEHTLIISYGTTFPAANSSAFAGTAVTCSATSRVRDSGLKYVMILGFAQASSCSNEDASIYETVFWDANSGIFSFNSNDTSSWHNLRGWPFATAGTQGVASTAVSGSGTLATINFTGTAVIPVGDQVRISGVTPTGYNGIWIVTASSAGSVSFVNTTTGAQTVAGTVLDISALYARSGIGIHVSGQSDNLNMNNAYAGGYTTNFKFDGTGQILGGDWYSDGFLAASASQTGVDFAGFVGRTTLGSLNITAGSQGVVFENQNITANVSIASLFVSATNTTGNCVVATSGYNSIGSLQATGCGNAAIKFTSTSAHLSIGSAVMTSSAGSFSNAYILATPGQTADQMLFGTPPVTDQTPGTPLFGGSLVSLPSLASAATMALPSTFNQFLITGTTNITSISGGYGGRQILLNFQGALQVGNGGNIALAGAAVFNTAVGSILSLQFDSAAGFWREISRSSP